MVYKFCPFIGINEGIFARSDHFFVFYNGVVIPDVISDKYVNVYAQKSLTASDIVLAAALIIGFEARNK